MGLVGPSGDISELVDETSGKEIVIAPVVVDQFQDLRKKYEQFLILTGTEWKEWLRNNVKEVVLPCDINLFLKSTSEFENHASYGSDTGHFISQLIQNSYKAGNNEFELDVNSLKTMDSLASNISGTEERMVRVVVTGETGTFCGWKATYSTFTVEKAGNCYGYGSKHSTFTIEKAGKVCGFGAYYSTFKTHNPNQYERFKEYTSQNSGNKLYLLSPDGSILKGGPW